MCHVSLGHQSLTTSHTRTYCVFRITRRILLCFLTYVVFVSLVYITIKLKIVPKKIKARS